MVTRSTLAGTTDKWERQDYRMTPSVSTPKLGKLSLDVFHADGSRLDELVDSDGFVAAGTAATEAYSPAEDVAVGASLVAQVAGLAGWAGVDGDGTTVPARWHLDSCGRRRRR